MIKFFKKRKKLLIFLAIIVVVVVLIVIFAPKKDESEKYATTFVEKKDLIQTVSEVGTVKASSEIELSFLTSGNLNKKYVKIGDKIKKGQILAELDYGGLIIQREEAQSSLDVARANLNKILSGATTEERAVVMAQAEKARKTYLAALSNLEKVQITVAESVSQARKSLSDLESVGADNVTTYEQAVISAQVDLDNTKATYQKDVDNYIDSALSAIDAKLSVANTALDNIFTIIDNSAIADELSTKNKAYLANTEFTYDQSQVLVVDANDSFLKASSKKTESLVNQAINDTLIFLNKVADSLDHCYNALEASTMVQATIDAYKASISAQIAVVSTAISAVQSAEQNLADATLAYDTRVSDSRDSLVQAQVALDSAILIAKNSLATAQTNGDEKVSGAQSNVDTSEEVWEISKRELEKLNAPARLEDVALYKAKVSQAQSSLDLINKRIEDSIIKSPIDGEVVKVEYEIGEQTLVGKTAFSVLGENNFEIEVDISESDIAKVKKGQISEITLDAFGEDTYFEAMVNFIEPAETVISEVIYYKVKIKFIENEEKMSQVKPGMTANVTITTNEKKDVLVVPSRAVVEKNGSGKVIRVLKDGEVVDKSVKTGIRGDGGEIEILQGIKELEEIITFIKFKQF